MLEILSPQAVVGALCPSKHGNHDAATVEGLKLLAMRFDVLSGWFRLCLSEKKSQRSRSFCAGAFQHNVS